MRTASLSPAVTEILFALGLEKQIVCVDRFSDYPDGAQSMPHLRGHQKIRKEDIQMYKPEIIFTSTLVQQKLAQELEYPAWKVIHQDPRSLNDIYECIRTIGLLFDKSKAAKALNKSMREGFNAMKKKAALLPDRLKVYVEEWHNPPMVSGNWVPEVVRIAGGNPLTFEAGAPSHEVSLEEIQQFDPDMIVLSICGAGKFAEKTLLTNRKGWHELRAVRHNAIKIIDDSLLNRPGPRLVEGAQRIYGWLFELLH